MLTDWRKDNLTDVIVKAYRCAAQAKQHRLATELGDVSHAEVQIGIFEVSEFGRAGRWIGFHPNKGAGGILESTRGIDLKRERIVRPRRPRKESAIGSGEAPEERRNRIDLSNAECVIMLGGGAVLTFVKKGLVVPRKIRIDHAELATRIDKLAQVVDDAAMFDAGPIGFPLLLALKLTMDAVKAAACLALGFGDVSLESAGIEPGQILPIAGLGFTDTEIGELRRFILF